MLLSQFCKNGVMKQSLIMTMKNKILLIALAVFLPGQLLAGFMERPQSRELTDFQLVQVAKRGNKQIGGWLPGKVPGDVMTDLMAAGKLEDPYIDFNSRKALWVNNYDWLYKASFDAAPAEGERAWILFHGIDYESQGFLNGQKIFEHTGMFSRVLVDASPLLNKDRSNILEVKLIGQGNRMHSPNYQLDQLLEQMKRRKTLKTQMSYGWDIAVELVDAGIWDKVELFKTGPAMIEDIGIRTKNSGEVALDVSLDSSQTGKAILKISVAPANFRDIKPVFAKDFPIDLKSGKSTTNPQFLIPNPQLWWTPELGNPSLYRLRAEILVDGKASDAAEQTFGFREITWEKNPGTSEDWKWVMRLNGKRLFLRGANWVPPDEMIGRLDDSKYEKLIDMAREAHINIFRVWGGGNREREAFYYAADRAGIMLWQEFPFACVYMPPYPTDKKFLSLVEQEVSEIVIALRDHPSVALYSGGNEFVVDSNRKVVEVMRKVVSRLDPLRRFIAASPAEGDSHNWIVWHQRGNLEDYFADNHALMSEFGIQALPDAKIIEKYISPDLRWPLSGPVYKHHDLEYGKIMKYVSVLSHDENLASYVHASQEMQAYYYQRAIEHWRIRKYRVSGTLFWMFEESWPGMVGSVVDYDLQPKLAYMQMQDTYNPVLIAADLDIRAWKPGDDFKSDIFLVNDTSQELSVLKIEALVGGKPAGNWSIDSEPDSSVKIASISTRIPAGGPATLELFVKQDDKTIAHNLYNLSICDTRSASSFASGLEKLTKKIMSGEEKRQ